MPPAVLEQDRRPRIRLWPALPHPGQNSLAESFNLFEPLVFHFWNGNIIIIVINFIVIIASDGCEDRILPTVQVVHTCGTVVTSTHGQGRQQPE